MADAPHDPQKAVRAIEEVERMKYRRLLKRSRAQMKMLGFNDEEQEKGYNSTFAIDFDANGRRRISRVDNEEPILGVQPEPAGDITLEVVGGGTLYRLAANGSGSLTFGGPKNVLGRSGALTRINIHPINAEGGPYVPNSTPLRLGLLQAKRSNKAAQLLPDDFLAAGVITRFIRTQFLGSGSDGVEEDDVLGMLTPQTGYVINIVNFAGFAFDFTCDASIT